ncbi:VanZ family protein, partial [Halobacillus trueperi]
LPLGIIAPILFNSIYRYKHIIYVSMAIRVVIEVLQYNTSLGVFDVDDIILSLTGSLIGFSLYIKYIK